ncbi:MAG: RNA-guided endonuclease InsQ/TnpB family protein [Cetobacterium sp.]
MIITKKIKLTILNEEDYLKLRDLDYKNRLAHNAVVNTFYTLNAFKDTFANENESLAVKISDLNSKRSGLIAELKVETNDKKKDKIKKEIEKVQKDTIKLNIDTKKEASELIQNFFGCTEQNVGYRALGRFDIPSVVTSKIARYVEASLKEEYIGVLKGERSIRQYKKSTPIPSAQNTFRFHEEHGSFYLGWRLRDDFNFQFRCRVKGDLAESLRKVISGEWKMCDSSVQVDGKDFYCLLSLDVPNRTNELDKEKVLGVDLGIKYPAYYATNFSKWVKGGLGSIDSFLKVRMALQKKKVETQKAVVLATGGKGRNKKVQSVDTIKDKERNFAKTYNHQLSAEIIKVALKNRCGVIKLEKLTKNGFDSKLLRNWSYFELQTMIQYKAKMNGIEVLFINPAYTSQMCSECGNIDKENRPTQEQFRCTKCGFEANADHNASINIAKSEQYI